MTERVHRVLVGPTGSGKKTVASILSVRHGLPLLSMDSMKVYRGMDVGTDKPGPEMQARTPFACLDLVGHDEAFSAGRWIEEARIVVERQGRDCLFAGGTPLYLRLLVEGLFPGPPPDPQVRQALEDLWEAGGESAVRAALAEVDPESEQRLRPGDRKRLVRALEVHRVSGRRMSEWQREETAPPIPGRFVLAALRHDPDVQRERSAVRIERMLEGGLVEEVAGLQRRAPFAPEPGRAIGYAEAMAHLAGDLTRQTMAERMQVRTRQLVRKQRMFLASFTELRWVDVRPGEDAEVLAGRVGEALEL